MKNQILFRNIGLYILLIAIFATTAMAFTITFETPTGGESFEDEITLFNVSIDLGANANCTFNISDGVHTDVINSTNNNYPNFDNDWSPVDISSLNDGDLDVNVYCVEYTNASNFNSTNITIEKETTGPNLTWFNPTNGETLSGNTTITLTVNITSDKPIDNNSIDAFDVVCDSGPSSFTLIGNSIFNMIDPNNGTVTQNLSTPFNAAACTFTVEVCNEC